MQQKVNKKQKTEKTTIQLKNRRVVQDKSKEEIQMTNKYVKNTQDH